MKELSVEEKAKRYDEAIEKLRNAFYDNNSRMCEEYRNAALKIIEPLFPELKESEDEKVCKEIKQFIRSRGMQLAQSKVESWIAWLEKQVEQKHTAEEVLIKAGLKPYKDGDQWCVLLGDNIQEGICGFGNTIEDALYAFLKDLIASQGEQKPYGQRDECLDCQFNYAGECKGYCNMKRGEQKPVDSFIEEEKPLLEKFKQAVYDCAWGKVTCKKEGETKEEYANRWAEHFLLMVRDWADDYIDFTIQQKLRNSYEKGKADIIEQKPAWSEEDKEMLDGIIVDVEVLKEQDRTKDGKAAYQKEIDWLKNLKDRVLPQPHQEWSEEKEKDLFNAAKHLREYAERCVQGEYSKIEIFSLADRIESFRPQNTWKPVDKNVYVVNGIVLAQKKDKSDLFKGYVLCKDHTLTPDEYERYINISDINSQSHWKPSDKQLEALEHSLGDYNIKIFEDRYEILKSLYQDLKKLMDEQL